jgi:small-conductance mechanosensitive channel
VPDIEFLDRTLYGATLTEWLAAIATLAGVFAGLAALRRLLVRRLGAIAVRSATRADDLAVEMIARTRLYFLFMIAVYAATRAVEPARDVMRILNAIFVVVVLMQVGRWGNGLIGFAVDRYARQRAAGDVGVRTTIEALGYAGRFLLWVILLITALQNVGINVTALVTGLGIGGVAIALALQNVLGDLFAALSIVLDKPFVVGDAIQVDNINGTIEHVGLKTTRIRSLSGEQIIVANADLLKSRIRNWKRMEQRRIAFNVDLAFDTPPDKVAGVPAMMRQIIEAQPLARFDRCHWLTTEPSGLRLETVYFVLDADYNRYADIQHAINLEMLRKLQGNNIEFGFATRMLNLQMNEGAGRRTIHAEPG